MTAAPAAIAPITPDALPALLALNNAHATELSWLDEERFAALVGQAFHARRIGNAEAFLIAFDERADYASPNYLWCRARYERFAYVDRVAVAPAARRRGYALRLYADLVERAAQAGHGVVLCEVNSDPPNPLSDAFHARLGFHEIGTAALPDRGKLVRYLALPILPQSP